MDVCSVLKTTLQNGVSGRGTEGYVKLLKDLGAEAPRVDNLPRTFRTTKKRIVEGYDTSCFCKYECTTPADAKGKRKPTKAHFTLKDFQAALQELLCDPELVQPGNFYFGDSTPRRQGAVTHFRPHDGYLGQTP